MRAFMLTAVTAGVLAASSVAALAGDPAPVAITAPYHQETQPTSIATPDGVGTTAANPNEVVCRAGEPVTGSHFPGPRTCRTQREWDAQRQAAQSALRELSAHNAMYGTVDHGSGGR